MKKTDFSYKQKIAGQLVSVLVRLIKLTLKWEDQGLYNSESNHWSTEEPAILVFWHSQQLFMPWVYINAKTSKTPKPFYAIVSKHGDGRLAASLIESFSIGTIAGSSNDGGRRAFVKMHQKLKQDCHVAITPDGPTGPIEVAKMGAIKLASMSGAKIIPVALGSNSTWTFNSWDKLFIPKPFSKTILIMGDSYQVKPDLNKEELASETKNLTSILRNLNHKLQNKLSS